MLIANGESLVTTMVWLEKTFMNHKTDPNHLMWWISSVISKCSRHCSGSPLADCPRSWSLGLTSRFVGDLFAFGGCYSSLAKHSWPRYTRLLYPTCGFHTCYMFALFFYVPWLLVMSPDQCTCANHFYELWFRCDCLNVEFLLVCPCYVLHTLFFVYTKHAPVN